MATIAAAHPAAAAQPATENKAATKSWRDKPDPIDERLISDGGIYDVVVVGGGNAGLVCARAASMKGASVAVIENQAEKGYEQGVGKEVGIVNSQYAMDHGAPRIDEDDFLREWARRNVIRHNPKRASYFVKNSGRIFDWLISFAPKGWMEENCHVMSCPPRPEVLMEVSGWKFYYGSAIFLNMKSEPYYGYETWPELLEVHHEKAMADGARWFFEHHAEICDVDSSGAVTGVVAKRSDGKYVRFKARKGVALCAGGFVGNREMVLDILDTVRHEAEARGDLSLVGARGGGGAPGGGAPGGGAPGGGAPSGGAPGGGARGGGAPGGGALPAIGVGAASDGIPRDGFGIKMGVWAGGHVEIGPRATMGSGDPGTGVWHLQLNSNGERFYDEAAGTTLNQPSDSFTVTFHDANWKKVYRMMPPRHMAPDSGDTISWPASLSQLDDVKPGPKKYSWGQQMYIRGPMRNEGGTLYCANTIEELLDYMDCYKGENRKRALAEITRYNKMCEKGVDEDFGKDRRIMKATALKEPPFYGTVAKKDGMGGFGPLSAGMVSTTGLDTDAEGRVLNSEFKPIKGLYAAGNNAGGRFIVVYQTPLSGISIGMAMTEGYMLGERLADL
jgi:succinate dehydrogenase/fumarate reductase flavoprotein subunit